MMFWNGQNKEEGKMEKISECIFEINPMGLSPNEFTGQNKQTNKNRERKKIQT